MKIEITMIWLAMHKQGALELVLPADLSSYQQG